MPVIQHMAYRFRKMLLLSLASDNNEAARRETWQDPRLWTMHSHRIGKLTFAISMTTMAVADWGVRRWDSLWIDGL